MASATAFTTLIALGPEDTMEMSSPGGRTLDNDIDIDFDDYQEGGQPEDDERMLEDGEPMRSIPATDEMMDDGDPAVTEEIMQDDTGAPVMEPVQEDDDELIDYGDDDYINQDDASFDNAGIQASTLLEVQPAVVDQHQGDSSSRPLDHLEPTFEPFSESAELSPGTVQPDPLNSNLHIMSSTANNHPSSTTPDHDKSHDDQQPEAQADEAGELLETTDVIEEEAHRDLPEPDQPLQVSVNPDAVPADGRDAPPTPTDTGLHPIIIRYNDLQIPLFRSRAQPRGLLKDDNLANLSLADLTENCKQHLAASTGDLFSEDYEFRLTFDQLGLILVENSNAAFSTSLNDILQVYLELSRNDGMEDIPELMISCSVQLKFVSGLNVLKQAASQGQGISAFSGFPVGDGYDAHGQEQDYGDPELVDHADANGDDFAGQGNANHNDNTQADDVQAAGEGDVVDSEPAHQEYHEAEGDGKEHGDEPYYADDHHEDGHYEAELSNAQEVIEEVEEGTYQAAESPEHHGPVSDTYDGEYAEEDRIVWDNDDLTYPCQGEDPDPNFFDSNFESPEDHADGQEEYQGYDAEETVYEDTTAPEISNDFASASSDQHQPRPSAQAIEPENNVDEDYSAYLEQGGDAEGEDAHSDHHGDEPAEEAGHEDKSYDQADLIDDELEEQGQLPVGDDEGEEEQFHTAHDLLAGHEDEADPQQPASHEEVAADELTEYLNEDDIGFDDDDLEPTTPVTAPAAPPRPVNGAGAVSSSPHGKRSLDDTLEFDDFDDEPEPKKARAK